MQAEALFRAGMYSVPLDWIYISYYSICTRYEDR
jgi:hypothetical protein